VVAKPAVRAGNAGRQGTAALGCGEGRTGWGLAGSWRTGRDGSHLGVTDDH
jgi:hypothetical protein